jgi:hypothetical protein
VTRPQLPRNSAGDPAVAAEAELIITRDVAPAVAAIEESVSENRLSTALARALSDKPYALASGTVLSLLISQVSALPDVVGAALSGTAALAPAAYDALERWKERQRAVEQHQLYFYYRVDRDLRK